MIHFSYFTHSGPLRNSYYHFPLRNFDFEASLQENLSSTPYESSPQRASSLIIDVADGDPLKKVKRPILLQKLFPIFLRIEQQAVKYFPVVKSTILQSQYTDGDKMFFMNLMRKMV